MNPPYAILNAFERAAHRLGLDPAADERARKAAYRRAVAAHPPDRDPAAFREIREAFELLSEPITQAAALLDRQAPHLPPPRLAEVETTLDPTPLPEHVLRTAVGALPRARARALAAASRGAPSALPEEGER